MYTLILVLLLGVAIYFAALSQKNKRLFFGVTRDRDQIAFVLDNLHDGLVEYTADFRVTRINQAATELLGVSASEVVGKKLSADDVKNEDLSALVRATFSVFGEKKGQLAGGSGENKRFSVETYEVVTDYPVKKKLQVFTAPKIESRSNKPTGFIKIIRDITREDIISHSKSDLVTAVAHQLRTPLASIRWIFSALLDGDFGEISQNQRGLFSRGLKTNGDLVRLVDDILDVSRIEEARFEYNITDEDMTKVIKTVTNELENKAREHKVNLLTKFSESPIPAKIDLERIKMALTNLIDNAIVYSRPGSNVTIALENDREKVKISVLDQGIGIPRENRPNLFNKFYRAENAKRVKPRGTGLGLFLVKTIAEGHGGKISYSSEENRGSTFTLELPREPKIHHGLGRYESIGGKPEAVVGL